MTAESAPRPGWEALPGRAGEPAAVRGAARLPVRGRARWRQAAEAGPAIPATRWPRWSATCARESWRCSRRRAGPAARAPRRRTPPAAASSSCAAQGLSVYEISARLAAGGNPAGPHRRQRHPARGRIRPAAARPRARGQHQPGHLRPRHPPAGRRRHRLRRPARPRPHHHGRAAAGHPRPGRPRPARAWSAAAGYPGTRRSRPALAAVPAGPQAHRHPARVPRR